YSLFAALAAFNFASRQRRLNSTVADATPRLYADSPALKPCHYPNFCAKRRITFSACGAGDRIKPGVERDSAQPQEYGATNTIKPANAGGSFFVLRAFIIIKVASIAVARFAGLLINHPSYLGLRAVALYRPETWWTGVRRHGGHLSIISLSLSEVKRSNFLM